ncbi:MAG: response regulator [Gammaproteobacteria bacterium]|nr:response regulator [Gammaproteobacteria bacterium]
MKALVADDELLALYNINSIVSKNEHIESVEQFSNSSQALEYVKNNDVDIAFLDIEMGVVSGIDVAKAIRARNFNTYIVFTSGYDYAITAFEIKANGYVLKPYDSSKIDYEIECAFDRLSVLNGQSLTPIGSKIDKNKRIRFKTMPSFDMFVDGKIVPITSAKSKEFLALLVDRKGSSMTLDYIVSVLWEDKDDSTGKAYFRVILQRLNNVLRSLDIEDLIIHSKNQYSLNTELCTCDYYDILKGDRQTMEQFVGEYMNEYSWAEDTTSVLFRLTDPNSAKK